MHINQIQANPLSSCVAKMRDPASNMAMKVAAAVGAVFSALILNPQIALINLAIRAINWLSGSSQQPAAPAQQPVAPAPRVLSDEAQAKQAARAAKKFAVSNRKNLQAGFSAWSDAHMPVATRRPPSPKAQPLSPKNQDLMDWKKAHQASA